jgi:hypothetical protein
MLIFIKQLVAVVLEEVKVQQMLVPALLLEPVD